MRKLTPLMPAFAILAAPMLVAVPLTPASVYVFASVMGFLWLSTVPATNALVAAVFFVVLSFAVKSLSVSARTTPARWPN